MQQLTTIPSDWLRPGAVVECTPENMALLLRGFSETRSEVVTLARVIKGGGLITLRAAEYNEAMRIVNAAIKADDAAKEAA